MAHGRCVQGQVLTQFPDLSSDSLALIWTMADRQDADSPWQRFWESLPGSFGTGLSMAQAAIDVLQDTPLHVPCMEARQVVYV